MSSKTLIVIGGGAAGFFCAVNAAGMHPGLKVHLLEKTTKLLSKVKVSGGGRCNVTHACFSIADMSKRYPRGRNFVKKSFHHFFTTDTIKWFEERGVKLKAEADGRMFPVTDSSQTIIDCLLKEADLHGVKISTGTEVRKISKEGEKFKLELSGGNTLYADYVCVATGGYAKSSMFDWLRELGHTIAEPVPSLFTFNLPKHPITQLMGISVPNARVKIEGSKLVEEGPVLVTHWGLSGPAILRLSAWGAEVLNKVDYNFKVHINWLSEYTDQKLKAFFQSERANSPTKKLANVSLPGIPARLWLFFLQESGVKTDARWADLPAKEENKLIQTLTDYTVEVRGKTTFKEEFVTAGGIELSDIDHSTMQSRIVPGLYFAGEVMNVDGITGGFNFQHAWTSGWLAARSISNF